MIYFKELITEKEALSIRTKLDLGISTSKGPIAAIKGPTLAIKYSKYLTFFIKLVTFSNHFLIMNTKRSILCANIGLWPKNLSLKN